MKLLIVGVVISTGILMIPIGVGVGDVAIAHPVPTIMLSAAGPFVINARAELIAHQATYIGVGPDEPDSPSVDDKKVGVPPSGTR